MKSDSYRAARGGWSRVLQISCEKCGHTICKYQKDGPGPLKRMYFDRMFDFEVSKSKLICGNCSTVLGIRVVYEKENRLVYRLFQDSVKKKIMSQRKTA